MKACEFVKLEVSNVMFEIVDANKPGYMTRPELMLIADRNVVTKQFSDWAVVGFEPITKRRIRLYIKEDKNYGKNNK